MTLENVVAPETVDNMMWSVVKSELNMVNETVDGVERKAKEAMDVSIEWARTMRISETETRIVCEEAMKAADEVHKEGAILVRIVLENNS